MITNAKVGLEVKITALESELEDYKKNLRKAITERAKDRYAKLIISTNGTLNLLLEQRNMSISGIAARFLPF